MSQFNQQHQLIQNKNYVGLFSTANIEKNITRLQLTTESVETIDRV